MTSTELLDFISLGEGFTIEFKRSLTTSIGRELCAFANSSGGYVFIGVENSGVICGVQKHNTLKSELQSIARNPLLFGIFFRMNIVEQLGSGIKRILELSREYGTPEPVIETDNNWVTVTFPRDPAKAGIPEESEGPVKGTVGGPVEGPVSLSVLKQKILLQCEK